MVVSERPALSGRHAGGNIGLLFVPPKKYENEASALSLYSVYLYHNARGPQERRRSPFSIHFTAEIGFFSRTGAFSRCFYSGA